MGAYDLTVGNLFGSNIFNMFALAIADEAVAVAKDNKGLIAATVAALIAWAFRAPLLELITAKRGGQAPVQPEPANDDFAETTEEQAQ
jgi:phosphotransferase system  glucose/maltose/N-acetylglucosamine-specific IIC component